ncbi:MAG: hypothetical protein JWL61_1086 [Gemmatimonadetes bacterium]|nr:hypothetical protein [Gemmatimonadota bacterium]
MSSLTLAIVQVSEAKALLAGGGEDEPIILPRSVLSSLDVADMPPNTAIEVGAVRDGVMHLDWNGMLSVKDGYVSGSAEILNTRKYWYSPLGLEHYCDLIRRAAEVRERVHGDVTAVDVDDDGAYVRLTFGINTQSENLGEGFKRILAITAELEEAADAAVEQIGKQVALIASRLSGWGSTSLDTLADTVASATSTDERGRSLEELVSRLFEGVPGFSVTGRIRTATEEIDLSVLNGSDDPRFRRESALILVECKNWSGKCGKNELVAFREKVLNRRTRASLGFLISWNGFARTVDKELLRGSRESAVIVPITGKEIRSAIRSAEFTSLLVGAWERAVST